MIRTCGSREGAPSRKMICKEGTVTLLGVHGSNAGQELLEWVVVPGGGRRQAAAGQPVICCQVANRSVISSR